MVLIHIFGPAPLQWSFVPDSIYFNHRSDTPIQTPPLIQGQVNEYSVLLVRRNPNDQQYEEAEEIKNSGQISHDSFKNHP